MPDAQIKAARALAVCSAAGVAVLAAGLVLQHGFGLQPCAWCVLQRLIFVAIVVTSALGAFVVRARIGRLFFALATDALAMTGAGVALYQHLVASRSESCGISLADKIIMQFSLHELAPWMFYADAPCSEANLPLFGVPFALWGLAAFLALGACASVAMIRLLRRAAG